MEKGKITEIGIKYNYGFYNGGFIKFKIGKTENLWHSTDRLIEEFCMKLGIYKEDDMQRLKDKWFYIHDYEYFEDGDYKCEIEIINKKINPENKKFWIYVKN